MIIRRTPRDATSDPSGPQTWITGDTHWWDSSQVYGRDKEFADKARTGEGGRLRIEPDGTLPEELEEDLDYTDVPGTMWHGLYALHVLFSMEHNAIADRIRAEYPTWSDEQLYDKARLVNSALIAKIHTLDWTPVDHQYADAAAGDEGELVGARRRVDAQARRPDQQERRDQRHPRLACRPPRRPVLADGRVRRRLPDAPADPGRVRVPLAGRQGSRRAHLPRAERPARPRARGRDVDAEHALLDGHVASRARSRCTTTRASSSTSTGPTGSRWISPRSTSCARASGASRGTRSSVSSST